MAAKTVRLVLVGGKGMLATMVRRLAPPCYEVIPLDLPDFDITDRTLVLERLRALAPEVILNCAAYTDVDGCESQEEFATRVNGAGVGHLAEAALDLGAVLIHVSTDYVFDGRKETPYAEEDGPAPRSAYGRSKLAGEEAVRTSGLERYFIVRTSWLYGPGGKNFVETMIRLAKEREELRVVADQVGCPTFTADLVEAIFRLLATGTFGLYHFSDEGVCSWHGFAEAILAEVREEGEELRAQRVVPIATEDYPLPAPRPAYSVMSKAKYRLATGAVPPSWRESLKTYLALRKE